MEYSANLALQKLGFIYLFCTQAPNVIVGVCFEVKTDLMLFHTAKWPAIPTLRQFEILKMNKKV